MQDVLSNPTDQANKDISVAAFGQKAYNDNLPDIAANIDTIDNTELKVRLDRHGWGFQRFLNKWLDEPDCRRKCRRRLQGKG